jgi:hypothetical protein
MRMRESARSRRCRMRIEFGRVSAPAAPRGFPQPNLHQDWRGELRLARRNRAAGGRNDRT